MRQPPAPGALDKFAVNSAQGMDVVWQPLYDYTTYAAAGQTSLTFFQTPIGQGGKTLADTNLESAGQLPSPQKFIVESISIDFFPGGDVNGTTVDGSAANWDDVYTVMKSGWLDFVVGSKSRLQQAPLGAFPPAYRLGGGAALTGAASVANTITSVDYASFAGKEFSIIPVTLPATQNFKVTLNWPTAVAINVDARIGVKLNGTLFRAVQ